MSITDTDLPTCDRCGRVAPLRRLGSLALCPRCHTYQFSGYAADARRLTEHNWSPLIRPLTPTPTSARKRLIDANGTRDAA